MTTITKHDSATSNKEVEFASFYVSDLLIGVDILQVQEINRQLTLTNVPHAETYVRGVVNLRGEVITVVDLRTILGLTPSEITTDSRNVVVNIGDEKIGLLADKVAEVVCTTWDKIDPTPANIGGVEGRFFKGVRRLEKELLVILDVEEILQVGGDSQSSGE